MRERENTGGRYKSLWQYNGDRPGQCVTTGYGAWRQVAGKLLSLSVEVQWLTPKTKALGLSVVMVQQFAIVFPKLETNLRQLYGGGRR